MIKRLLDKLLSERQPSRAKLKKNSTRKLPGKPRMKTLTFDSAGSVAYPDLETNRARLELYRFLRDNIPILSSVIWTWVRLCASTFEYQLVEKLPSETENRARQIIDDFSQRIYQNDLIKQGGLRELLIQFFESLFTDGAVCGELQLSPSRRNVERFLFADMKTISIEHQANKLRLYQVDGDSKILLNNQSLFYYGLGTAPGDVTGRSLLQAIPFVARVEQTLVSDMHRSMRNAGYHRIHVKVTPPEKRPDESEEDFINRANGYFDDTVEMMRDFGPYKNPVTWDDVKIEYIGPSAKFSASNAWYINHKAMIEDICAGTHLAPFMLGYAYGTTHNWAEFKYELVARQVETVQNAAASLLNWLTNIELALNGINVTVRYRFKNRINVGMAERANAEKIQIENVITKLNNNLIDRDEALRQLASI